MAVAGDPKDHGTFYFGGCAGGVWKTTDRGTYWHNISDGFFRTSSVGAIAVAESDAIPFASGVTGEPIEYDWRLDPHLILLGGTGSGKSASMSNLIAGALIRGADVYIADPTKGCADFMFSAPWVKAMATSPTGTGSSAREISCFPSHQSLIPTSQKSKP